MKLSRYSMLICLLMCAKLNAQVTESFDAWTDGIYGTTSNYTGLGGQWETYNSITSSTNSRSGNAVRFNDNSAQDEYLLFTGSDGNGKDNGLGVVSFYYRHWDADGSSVQFKVQYNQSGGGWTDIGSTTTVTSTTYTQFSSVMDISGSDIKVRIISIADDERLLIDDIELTDYPVNTPSTLAAGDLAIVGVNANNVVCSSITAEDEISFVCFVDIANTTPIDFTDNGWERTNSSKWGDTEGTIRATRNGATIAAGTVVTFRMDNTGTYTSVSPDANWTFSSLNGGQTFNMNSGGDQIYFMQRGTWTNGGSAQDGTYTGGDILFGFNTNTAWSADGTSQQSNLYESMNCFSMAPTSSSDYNKYTGATTAANKRTWIKRISDSANWTAYANCTDYNSTGPSYNGSYTLSIISGTMTQGEWVGDDGTDWFDCANWKALEIPTSTTDVTIPTSGVTNEPTIATAGAICRDLFIENGRTLTINASGTLGLLRHFTNNGTLIQTAGTVSLTGTSDATISGSNVIDFFNLSVNKSSSNVTLSRNIEVSNTLALTDGVITTGTNRIELTNITSANLSTFSNTSYVNGNLRRYINNSGTDASTYSFPVGNGTNTTSYQLIELVNDNLTGGSFSYLDAKFASLVTGGVLNVTEEGAKSDDMCTDGEWHLVPDNQPTSGTYDIMAHITNFSCSLSDDQFTLLKRGSSSSNAADWSCTPCGYGDPGINVDGGAGRLTSQGYAMRKGFTGFSKFGISYMTTPLPIKLISFNVDNSDNEVSVSWRTAHEHNNAYFNVERSPDGLNYFILGAIFSKGDTNDPTDYKFYDEDPLPGTSYYRLTQVDYNGLQETFDAQIISRQVDEQISIRKLGSKLLINNEDNKSISLSVHDITGKDMMKKETTQSAEIETNNWPTGIYILQTHDGTNRKTCKFIK